jgi:hypothetical protein
MRPFAFALFGLALAGPAFAADRPTDSAPEKLLPITTQFYLRWDGIAAHRAAYKNSIWGGIMAGPTGDSVRALLARGPKLLGSSVLAEPLLDGKPPAELKANLADLKAVERIAELVAGKGVILAAEVREPAPTIKGIGQTLGGLIGGKMPGPEALIPDAQVLVIVPDVGDKADILFGTLRLLMKKTEEKPEPFEAGGRKGFRVQQQGGGPIPLNLAWWLDGTHFVLYGGTRKPADVIAEMTANAAKGGVTAHPLYQRCLKTGSFESVTRGFVDTEKAINLAKSLGGPFVPGLKERLDGTGLGGVKAVVFASGFDGKESRALYELDAPGERRGLTRVLKGGVPLGLSDLPPLPPDVSRFSALRLDPAAAYDAGLGLSELLTMGDEYGVEEGDGKKNSAESIELRKEYLAREADKFLGISVTKDLLPHLGDKLVLFQSPSEGFQVFGQVVCVSVKDADKVKTALDRIQRGIEAAVKGPIKVRRRVLKGVEYREFYASGFGIVTPTYAIVDGWLVFAAHPQVVQGMILRARGVLPKWKPDDATARRLAKMPADGCGLQFCDPRSTASNLCMLGPLLPGLLNLESSDDETDFDPVDAGVVPNAHELCSHLFPNLTVTRDDGKTIRIDVNESFSLPLEMIGLEPLGLLAALGLYAF